MILAALLPRHPANKVDDHEELVEQTSNRLQLSENEPTEDGICWREGSTASFSLDF